MPQQKKWKYDMINNIAISSLANTFFFIFLFIEIISKIELIQPCTEARKESYLPTIYAHAGILREHYFKQIVYNFFTLAN